MNRRQALLTAASALAVPALMAAGGGWTPLDLGNGQILVRGELNKRPLLMLLDSGSAPTLVDTDQTRALGLSLSDGGSAIGTSGGAARAWKTGAFELSIAGLTIRFPPDSVLALDLSAISASAGAIVGQALFEAARLDLDLPRSRLRIAEPGPPAGWASLPLSLEEDGLRCVPLTVGTRPALAGTFDLGSRIPLQITRDWARAHGLLEGLRQSSWVATGIDGASRYTTAMLPRIELAGFVMRDVPVAITDTQPQGASPAVIGAPIWRRFRLLSDYAAATLWLKPDNARLKAQFNRDRSGLAVRFTGDALEVVHVAAASPAEAGGWTVGERVVAVDGRPVDATWPGSRQSGWARRKAGSRVRLTLADGRQRDLVLADYY